MDSEILDSVISQIKVCFVYFCVWVIVHPMTETWWKLVICKLSVLKLYNTVLFGDIQWTKSSLNLQIENELLHYDCPISCCFIEMYKLCILSDLQYLSAVFNASQPPAHSPHTLYCL